MIINTDFYGEKENWKSISTGAPEIKISGVTDPDPTLSTAEAADAVGSVHAFSYNTDTNPERLASVPLEQSICPWGIGAGSDAFNQKYVYPSIIGGSGIENFQFKVRTSQYYSELDNHSYRFFLSSCRTLQTINGRADGWWVNRYAELNLRTELDSHYIYQRPILEFDYSKAFVIANILYVPKTYIDDKSFEQLNIVISEYSVDNTPKSDNSSFSIFTLVGIIDIILFLFKSLIILPLDNSIIRSAYVYASFKL